MNTDLIFEIPKAHYFYLDNDFIKRYEGKQPDWGSSLSYVVYKRTYARPLKTGGTEEYWQTCKRVVETTYTIQKSHILKSKKRWNETKAQYSAQKMFELMWALLFTPPGRGLWAMDLDLLMKKGGGCVNNCGFKSTADIDLDFAEPFCFLMDFSMLGVGIGFDTLGAGKVTIQTPTIGNYTHTIEDSREGWLEALKILLNAFVGKGTLPGEFKLREYDVQSRNSVGELEYSKIVMEGLDYEFYKIRAENSGINTFGGTASGPWPLMDLLKRVYLILINRVGQLITSTDITDIQNLIGRCVVSGNVRRSAEIALGDKNDKDFYKLKDPTEKDALENKLKKLAKTIPGWKALQQKIEEINIIMEEYSQANPERVELRKKQILLEAEQRKLLNTSPEYLELEARLYELPLMCWRWASNNSVICQLGMSYDRLGKQCATNGEPAPFWLEVAQMYGRLIDPPNNKDRRAKGSNPCVEQTLEDDELCCLVETYPSRCKNMSEFLQVLKYAYLYAKTVTLIPTHYEPTNEVMSRNRRIGTSMAGIIEMYCNLGMQECKKWWDTGYKRICALDTKYSEWLGVPESIKKTSVKPGGTVPLLAGVEGGMKASESEYQFRTIRVDVKSPLVQAHIDAGYRVEQDVYTPRSSVIYFPIHDTRSKRFASDFTVWEQAEICAALQAYWADNQVSCTITFKMDEAKDIPRLLELFEGRLKSMSFLPLSEHGYVQAPYIACSREEYETAVSKIQPIDWTKISINNEALEKYCEGQVCERGA